MNLNHYIENYEMIKIKEPKFWQFSLQKLVKTNLLNSKNLNPLSLFVYFLVVKS